MDWDVITLEKESEVRRFPQPDAWNDTFGMPTRTLHAVIICGFMNFMGDSGTQFMRTGFAGGGRQDYPRTLKGEHVIWATLEGFRHTDPPNGVDGERINVTRATECNRWLEDKWDDIEARQNECPEFHEWNDPFLSRDLEGLIRQFQRCKIFDDTQELTFTLTPRGTMEVDGETFPYSDIAKAFATRMLNWFNKLPSPTVAAPVAGPSSSMGPPPSRR